MSGEPGWPGQSYRTSRLERTHIAKANSGKFKVAKVFCFGIEVVKNSEWAYVFCTVLTRGGEDPPITAIKDTPAPSEFLTTSIPKQKP